MHPVFEKYTLRHLHDRTLYSVAYLRALRGGQRPLTERAKLTFALALAEPQDALFATNGTEPVQAAV